MVPSPSYRYCLNNRLICPVEREGMLLPMIQMYQVHIHPVYMPTAIQYHPKKPPDSCSPTLNPVADTFQTFVSPGSQWLWVSSVTTDRQFCEKLIGNLTCTLDPSLS
nr:MAG TPA: hypothetical protein [Caudoviricetes sp.]